MESSFIPTTATLSHLQDDPVYKEEMPYEIWADNVSEDAQRTNVELDIVPDCSLTDVRSLGNERPELDKWGFEWMYQDFPYDTGLHNADYVEFPTLKQRDVLDRYLNSMSDFLREKLGCAKAVCWDWRVCTGTDSFAITFTNTFFLGQTLENDESSYQTEYLQLKIRRWARSPCR